MNGIFSGNIKGIGLSAFLQMVHMDRLTCTLFVEGEISRGSIYLQEGEIIHAEYKNFQPLEAVYAMIAMKDPEILMDTDLQRTKPSINKPMMQILMEGARRVDEQNDASGPEKNEKPDHDDLTPEEEEYIDLSIELEPLDLPEDILGPPTAVETEQPEDPAQETEAPPPQRPEKEEEPVIAFSRDAEKLPPEEPELPAFLRPNSTPPPAVPVKPQKEKKPKKGTTKKFLFLVAACLAICLVVGGLFFYVRYNVGYQHDTAYKKLQDTLGELTILEQQESVITQFMRSFPQSSHNTELRRKRENIAAQIRNRDFRELLAEEKTLSRDIPGIENALLLYERFITRHPRGAQSDEIRARQEQRISDMAHELIAIKPEDMLTELWLRAIKEFELRFPESPEIPLLEEEIRKRGDAIIADIASYSPQNDMERRHAIQRARSFLDNFTMHPEVNHVREMLRQLLVAERVATIVAKGTALNDLDEEILYYEREKRLELDESVRKELQKKISEIYTRIDMERKWTQLQRELQRPALTVNTRILLLEQYLVQFPPPEYAKEARKMLADIQKSAGRRPTSPPAQEQISIMPSPGESTPPTQTEIQTAKIRLEKTLADTEALIEPLANRFENLKDGTVRDLSTRQIWMFVDSEAYTGQCLNYEDAKTFVEYLGLGGNHDWRLPTAGELVVLFKNPPFFPSAVQDRWYWTSDAFVRGYRNEISVVTAKPETVFEKQHKTLNDCGYVLATRP